MPVIVVDDSGGENKVNFLLDDSIDIRSGHIMTKTYYDMYSQGEMTPDGNNYISGKFNIIQNPSLQDYIPGIYFFIEYNNEKNVNFSITNGGLITGYIMGPTATCSFNTPYIADYKYEVNELSIEKVDNNVEIQSKTISTVENINDDINKKGISVIGGVIFNNVTISNTSACAYVNPNALIEIKGKNGMTINEYDCLYYQAY